MPYPLALAAVLFRRSKYLTLAELIGACRQKKTAAQKKLFEIYYSQAITICLRYSGNREEAEDRFDEGFLCVLNKIPYYDAEQPFEAWFRTVLIQSVVDYNRKHQSFLLRTGIHGGHDLVEADYLPERLNADEILAIVQQLPPAYRTVFSLHVVDGYAHTQIAKMLDIQEEVSLAILVNARQTLQQRLALQASTTLISQEILRS